MAPTKLWWRSGWWGCRRWLGLSITQAVECGPGIRIRIRVVVRARLRVRVRVRIRIRIRVVVRARLPMLRLQIGLNCSWAQDKCMYKCICTIDSYPPVNTQCHPEQGIF